MDLVIVHHHFRPGGVRRVIELATPQLVLKLRPRPRRVILASGETPDADWLEGFKASVYPTPVLIQVEPTLAYIAEQRRRPAGLVSRMRPFLGRLLQCSEPAGCLVWAHNLGLGRNMLLTIELLRVCIARRLCLVFHHHDWWFDNRWARWPEMRRAGVRSVAAAARAIFAAAPRLKHVAINHADAKILQRHLGARTGWLPNPAGVHTVTSGKALRYAREWLYEALGERCPVWLMPCRLLRRKNIAEALLLTRWLRPEAWLVTTGGVTSPDEQAYYDRLCSSATEHQWRLRLGILESLRSSGRPGSSARHDDFHRFPRLEDASVPSRRGVEARKASPSVQELLGASETVLLTSLQEGFGLAYVEAAAAGRPLIARRLDNIMPDLTRFGFLFPQSYVQVLIDPTLFDWGAEAKRQARLFSNWRRQIPRTCRCFAGQPWLLRSARPCATPFNRLTLTAQLEVLRAPLETSWARCAPLNPFLSKWRRSAQQGALGVTVWPRQAEQWLGGSAYAGRFQRIVSGLSLDRQGEPPAPAAALATQKELMQQKLTTENLYPLVWSPET